MCSDVGYHGVRNRTLTVACGPPYTRSTPPAEELWSRRSAWSPFSLQAGAAWGTDTLASLLSGAVSDYYDTFADYQLRYLILPNPRFRAIRDRLRPLMTRQPKSALDIGCGIGVMTDWLAQSVDRVSGIDISPRNIRIACALSTRPRFSVCAIPDDPLPTGPFDLITLFDVLEHLEPRLRVQLFSQIGEVIAAEGIVAVNLPSRLYALDVPSELQQIVDEAVGADEIVALAATIGMEPLVVERYGIEVHNQYVFCAFSRTYSTAGPIEVNWRSKIQDRIAYYRSRRRHGNKIAQLRHL